MSAAELLVKLRDLKPMLKSTYRAKELALFGSFVRDEQAPDSDIDILVDFEDGADLLHTTGLAARLEEELRRNVDVVPKRGLREELRETVLREAITI